MQYILLFHCNSGWTHASQCYVMHALPVFYISFYSSFLDNFNKQQPLDSWVYWTVHHLHRWIKKYQLDVTCFIISVFTAQHVSNVSTSTFRSLRLIVDLFHVLYCFGSMCVGVTVWFGCGGVVFLCRLKHCVLRNVSVQVYCLGFKTAIFSLSIGYTCNETRRW